MFARKQQAEPTPPQASVYHDYDDDSLLGIIGALPTLIKNLINAEIARAKAWASSSGKDAGVGSVWFLAALFVLFWTVPVIFTVFIAVIAIWLPVWASALIVLGVGLLVIAVLVLLGLQRFKKVQQRQNPAAAMSKDVQLVKEARDAAWQ